MNAKAQAHQLEQALSKFFGQANPVPMESERKSVVYYSGTFNRGLSE